MRFLLLFIALIAVSNAEEDHSFELPSEWYNIRSNIDTSFSCVGRAYGYYADVANDCQVYHVCQPRLEDERTVYTHNPFICPLGTVFDQVVLTCVHATADFNCADSINHYVATENHFNTVSENLAPQNTPAVNNVVEPVDHIAENFDNVVGPVNSVITNAVAPPERIVVENAPAISHVEILPVENVPVVETEVRNAVDDLPKPEIPKDLPKPEIPKDLPKPEIPKDLPKPEIPKDLPKPEIPKDFPKFHQETHAEVNNEQVLSVPVVISSKYSRQNQQQIQVPQKQVEVPRKQIEVPRKQVEVPRKQVEVPRKQVEVPRKQVQAPQKQVEVPQKQVEVPQKQIEVPRKQQVQVPQKQIEVPRKQVQAPQKQVEVPQKQIEVPRKQVQVPQKQIEVPRKQVQVPQKQIEVPRKQVQASQKQVEIPNKGVQNLVYRPILKPMVRNQARLHYVPTWRHNYVHISRPTHIRYPIQWI